MCGLNFKSEAGNRCVTVDKTFDADRLVKDAAVKEVILPQNN